MTVYLGGQKIPGNNLHVSASLALASEDLSGNSSSTAQSEKGDKPKTMQIRTVIRFVDSVDLTFIFTLAEARTKSERTIYSIINDTAKAMNIREVRFDGSVQVTEQYNLRQWDVSFDLVEYRSVPEKKQEREAAKPVVPQAAAGSATAQPVSGTGAASTAEQLSWFESKVLKPANALLQ